MDDRYIDEVARLIEREIRRHRRAVCPKCGGNDTLTEAVPLDPDVTSCLPVVRCRACDGDDPAVAETFERLDRLKGEGPVPP
jgi:hypothetical protein